jgi:hypothetical protein
MMPDPVGAPAPELSASKSPWDKITACKATPVGNASWKMTGRLIVFG